MSVKRYPVSNGLLIVRGKEAYDTFNLQNVMVVLATDYDALAASVDRLTSDKARLAADYANTVQANAEVANINCDLNERIRALEAALMALANKCHGELGCPGYKLAYDLGLCPPAETKGEQG